MQRNPRTTLPSVKSSSKSRETDKSNQSHKIKKYHDQHARNLPDLQIGDTDFDKRHFQRNCGTEKEKFCQN